MSSGEEQRTIDTLETSPAGGVLLLDSKNSPELPANFRSTRDLYKTNDVNPPTRYGLDTLRASAARQFSELDLKASLERMSGKIYIVDLRREPHGFIDGSPISWYGLRNRASAGRSPEEIEALEWSQLSEIAAAGTARVGRIIKKTEGSVSESSVWDIPVNRAETERELVARLGLDYERFFVTDHEVPDDQSIDRFVNFVQSLPEDAWLHFHCRGGTGRATTFMVLYDILRNASMVSLSDIVQRNALIGPKNLFRLSKSKGKIWKYDLMAQRREFIKSFFSYVNDPKGAGIMSWTKWSVAKR